MFNTAVIAALAVALTLAMAVGETEAETGNQPVKISKQPLHSGRISPMLFGNFMELLDDLIPGMWAEMLNDRSFEGITRSSNWCYYDGEPNICDREWDKNNTWEYDTSNPFNGSHSVKLVMSNRKSASLAQSQLAVKKGNAYVFSGYLRSDSPTVQAQVVLKSLLPDGKWMVLGSAKLPELTSDWKKHTVKITSSGTTDSAVFELKVDGEGSVWADKLSLMPSGTVHGWRKDVVQAIKDVQPAIIRWGGSVCDPGGYRWKEGIGDRDRRVPFPNKVWGRLDSNDVGIDEFCRFCELVGAEPLICISYSDGPQSAADLVEYCNGDTGTVWGAKRAVNGHKAPYHVRYWQLGNELGDANYVNGLTDFCKAMKQVDPGVVLMSSFPSQEMLNKAGKDISYVGPHHYTPDFTACEADFKNLSAMIKNTPGCSHIRIGVTEWNVSGGNWGLMRGKFLTLETALLNARYLNLMMRYSDIVDIACRSNMTNSLGSGIIETNPSGLYKRPSYHVMKLYAQHHKPVPLKVEGSPDGVDLAACASGDCRSVCVFAVNSRAEPVEISLDLSEYGSNPHPAESEVVCDTLDARQPDVMNHWSAPDRVRPVKGWVSGDKVILPALSVSAIECLGRDQ